MLKVFSWPVRITPIAAVVPGARLLMVLATSRESRASLPLTATMTSPDSMPAFAAGAPRLGAGVGARRPRLRLGDQRPAWRLEPEVLREVGRDLLDLHADPAACH